MITGEFNTDLERYIAECNGRIEASKQSDLDITEYPNKSKGILENGKMYSFRYFTPDEPFYDTYPIVLGLGKSIDGHQLGINLHYIPYNTRIPFLNDIIKSFQGFIGSQIKQYPNNSERQLMINGFIYENIMKSLGRKYNIIYAVRQYMLSRMKNPVGICYEDWWLGAINDENYFFGGNINQAQALYYVNK